MKLKKDQSIIKVIFGVTSNVRFYVNSIEKVMELRKAIGVDK